MLKVLLDVVYKNDMKYCKNAMLLLTMHIKNVRGMRIIEWSSKKSYSHIANVIIYKKRFINMLTCSHKKYFYKSISKTFIILEMAKYKGNSTFLLNDM